MGVESILDKLIHPETPRIVEAYFRRGRCLMCEWTRRREGLPPEDCANEVHLALWQVGVIMERGGERISGVYHQGRGSITRGGKLYAADTFVADVVRTWARVGFKDPACDVAGAKEVAEAFRAFVEDDLRQKCADPSVEKKWTPGGGATA